MGYTYRGIHTLHAEVPLLLLRQSVQTAVAEEYTITSLMLDFSAKTKTDKRNPFSCLFICRRKMKTEVRPIWFFSGKWTNLGNRVSLSVVFLFFFFFGCRFFSFLIILIENGILTRNPF